MHQGPRNGAKFTTEERAMIARVMSRLKMKPYYFPLRVLSELWGTSMNYSGELIASARNIAYGSFVN